MRLPVLQFTIFICLQHTTELCHWSLKGHTNHWQPENDLYTKNSHKKIPFLFKNTACKHHCQVTIR